MSSKPLVCMDVDGVINLVDLPTGATDHVRFELLEGVPHAIVTEAGTCLEELGRVGEIAWATGWGPRANKLLAPLGIGPFAEVSFERLGSRTNAYWKAAGISEFATGRPVAWIDDSLDDRCQDWALERTQRGLPTLLVQVDPATGLGRREIELVKTWAGCLSERPRSA